MYVVKSPMTLLKCSLVHGGLFIALLATRANAQPVSTPVTVFDKVTIESGAGGHILVRRGGLIARIAEGSFIDPPVIDPKGKKVAFATQNDCLSNLGDKTFTFDQLSSRLENVTAYGLHRNKKYAESKMGFAKALQLDPTNRTAAVNLASAQQLLGEPAEAVKTLAPWLASDPIATFAKVASDAELAPLLASPELLAMKAKSSGNVKVGKLGIKGGFAYSDEKGLLATMRTESSWGVDDYYSLDIELYDTTGKRIAIIPLIQFEDSKSKIVRQRIIAAQQILRDLGFTTEATMAGKNTQADRDSDKFKFSFPKLKLGVVGQDGVISVYRGDTLRAKGNAETRIKSVNWSPRAKAMIISTLSPGREGCEGTDPTEILVLPVAAVK
jgi:hypothetical protein